MCLTYMSDVHLKEVYANGFEEEMERQVAAVASFLKKEYKKITGNTVSLTKEGEIDIYVENSTRVRSWATAKMNYKVGGLDQQMNNETAEPLPRTHPQPESNWKAFVEQGGWNGKGGKRPQNDTRKK